MTMEDSAQAHYPKVCAYRMSPADDVLRKKSSFRRKRCYGVSHGEMAKDAEQKSSVRYQIEYDWKKYCEF